jgi:hypothetical protein
MLSAFVQASSTAIQKPGATEPEAEHIFLVLETFRKHRLHVKMSKCEFIRSNISYLGHNISSAGIGVEER